LRQHDLKLRADRAVQAAEHPAEQAGPCGARNDRVDRDVGGGDPQSLGIAPWAGVRSRPSP
ncbi:hypothetical protein AB0K60_15585, partial [Thermopolyspora sp. NPDC052614]|uniref:hypothetical protein n=1 Tax=Thermopolyspora sp. NPDC052614 TaxID=3155682 RepID=UPI00341F7D25